MYAIRSYYAKSSPPSMSKKSINTEPTPMANQKVMNMAAKKIGMAANLFMTMRSILLVMLSAAVVLRCWVLLQMVV